jgi:hypothetical protein
VNEIIPLAADNAAKRQNSAFDIMVQKSHSLYEKLAHVKNEAGSFLLG